MFKKLAVLLLIISICLTLFLFPSCKKDSRTGELNARLEGSTLTWDAYDGAVSYTVKCALSGGSGYSITVKETSFSSPYTTPGEYHYTVSAKNKDGKVIAVSKTLSYHLGTGEATDAVLIGSADDLLAVKNSIKSTFGKTSVETPVYYRLTADIDLTGKKFTPIGTSSAPFRGVLDGAGHTIKGLSFTKCNTDGNMGLFGYIKNAIVKDLTLEDASLVFDKNSETKKGELNCGLLVGHSVSSMIDNCHVKGNIDILSNVITVDNQILSAGGVVGKVESGRISGVSYEGTVTAQYGRSYAGGLVGFAQGDDPDFMLLNSKSVATVSAVGTSYNASSNPVVSYAYARAGVLVGNLSHAGRLSSLLAIGSASASSTVDGTNKSDLTSGVIGRAKSNTSSVTIPMFNIFYDASIPDVVGTLSLLGAYANYIFPLTEEEMKQKDSYLVEGKDGLDFETYWDLPAGGVPTLKKVSSLGAQPDLELTIRSEVEKHDFSYTFPVRNVALPTYLDLNLASTVHALCYNVNSLLDKIGAGITAIYTDEEIERGVKVKFSAEGVEDLVITLKQATLRCYLQYGVHSAYDQPADIFGGYKIIDAASLKTYDFTNAKHITITFLSPESAEA